MCTAKRQNSSKRSQWGIEQQISKGYCPQGECVILKMPVFSGLHHHYFRKAIRWMEFFHSAGFGNRPWHQTTGSTGDFFFAITKISSPA